MVNANWFLILCIILPPGIETLNWTIQNSTLDLSKVTLFIAREHLSKFSSTLVIAERSLKPETRNINTLLLDYLLLHLQGTMAVELYFRIHKNPPWKYYIFFVDSAGALRQTLEEFPINIYGRQFYFLIILTKYTPNFQNTLERIFKLCYQFDVIHANVILDHPTQGVCMFTYKLFSPDECRVVRPLLYFRFNQGFQHLKTVFPEKLSNFYGCPLKVIGRILGPMLAFTGDPGHPRPVGRWANLAGFEGMLLKLIAESLNFTIELLPFSDREGCFSELLVGMADVAIGGFSGSDPDRRILSPSNLYLYSPYVFVVRGGHLVGSLGRLAMPFNYRVWILITFLLIFGTVIIQVFRFVKPSIRKFIFGERYDAPMLNVVAVFLGYPITQTPRRNFVRYLLMLWLLVTMVLRNAYQGSLYDAFRMDRFVRTPSGFDDLMKWNYKILITKEIAQLDIFTQNATTVVVNGTHSNRFQTLEGTRAKYATVALRDNYVYYIGRVYKRGSDLIMINDVVYMYHVVMYFPKNSIYLSAFNKKLEAFGFSGITRYIATKFTTEPALIWKYKQNPPEKALTNDRLKAMYAIIVSMEIVALIVFGLELLSAYSERLRRIIEWIN